MKTLRHMITLAAVVATYGATAQAPETTRILFVLDASYSMVNIWEGQPTMATAKQVLKELVDSLQKVDNLEMALRVYGHQYHFDEKNCSDSRLEVAFRPGNASQIKSRLNAIQPHGITPIAYSLEKAERDFPSDPNSRNILILITDGEESCEGDPCAVSRALQQKRVILKPFVIGIGQLQGGQIQLGCVGSYYEADKPKDLHNILQNILRNVLDRTTSQVNLLDVDRKPTETDVAMTFYFDEAQMSQYRYIHTINEAGYPDTLDVDPLNTYSLIVHTTPPVVVPGVKVKANQHNIIEAYTPMGSLNVTSQSSDTRIKCLVSSAGEDATLNVQSLNSTERYLVGSYDVEVLTIPRIVVHDVRIDERQTTQIKVPTAATVTFTSGFEVVGGIFIHREGRLEEIYQLNDRTLREVVMLQPGEYELIYRSRLSRSMKSTVVQKISVKPGESVSMKL
jgi:Ca-activated chloride channel family protein